MWMGIPSFENGVSVMGRHLSSAPALRADTGWPRDGRHGSVTGIVTENSRLGIRKCHVCN